MNAGNVSQIGCGRPHPTAHAVVCARQRAHPEDHRGRDEESGRVLTWPDAPIRPDIEKPLPPLPYLARDRHEHDVSCAFGNPQCELPGPHTPTTPKPPRSHRERVLSLVRVLLGLVVLVAILSAPAVLVAVYRWALT